MAARLQNVQFWEASVPAGLGPTSAQNDASLCQVVRAAFFLAREVVFLGRDRRVGAGPGVACPKSWRSGCEPAALATETFPACPPGPWALRAAARAASGLEVLVDGVADLALEGAQRFFAGL